jgi:hypothetical protein
MRALLILLSSASLLLSAEDDPKEVNLRFRALSLGEPLEQVAYVNGGKLVRFLVPSDFLSPPETYRGPARIEFFQNIVTPAGADERSPLRELMRANIEEARRQEGIYFQAQQAAGAVVANVPEGPAGDAARREADLILALAAPALEAAQDARKKAAELQTRIDRINPVRPDEKKPEEKSSAKSLATTKGLPKLGSVTAAEGDSLILLFSADGRGRRILKIQDPVQSHPYGTLRFLNLGTAPLQLFSLSGTAIAPPRQPTQFTPRRDQHGYVGIEIRDPANHGKVLRIVRARPEADARTTYLLLPEGDGLTVKGITERAPRKGP